MTSDAVKEAVERLERYFVDGPAPFGVYPETGVRKGVTADLRMVLATLSPHQEDEPDLIVTFGGDQGDRTIRHWTACQRVKAGSTWWLYGLDRFKAMRAWAEDEQKQRFRAEDQRTDARSRVAVLEAALTDLVAWADLVERCPAEFGSAENLRGPAWDDARAAMAGGVK